MKKTRVFISKLLALIILTACVPDSETDFNKIVNVKSGDGLEVTLDEDTSKKIYYSIERLEDSIDPKYVISTKPLHGELMGCGNSKDTLDCTYIPDMDFYGVDYIQIKSQDGAIISQDTATIKINVLPINDAPEISGTQEIKTPYNTNQILQALKGFDKEGDSLTYEISKSPSKGTLHNCFLLDSPFCTYNPDDGYSGLDSFRYKVKDNNGALSQDEVIVNIEIGAIPPPVANEVSSGPGVSLTLLEDQTLKFNYTIPTSDKSKDPKFSILKNVSNGVLKDCDSSDATKLICTYEPNKDFNGQDMIELRAQDGQVLAQNTAIIQFTVKPVNDAPVISGNQSLIVEHNKSKVFAALSASDIDQDSLEYIITEAPKNGSLMACFIGGSKDCTYKPNQDYTGADSLKYKVKDSQGLISQGEVLVSIIVQEAPLTPADISSGPGLKLILDEDQSLKFSYTIPTSNKSKDPKYTIVNNVINGVLKDCDTSDPKVLTCTYEPKKDFNGNDSLELRAQDGPVLALTNALIEFEVRPINDAPMITGSQTLEVEHNKAKEFMALDGTDIDQDALSYVITQGPTHGTLSSCFMSGSKNCTYLPNKDYAGSDLVKYKVQDANGLQSQDEVMVIINVKKAPVIEDVIKTCEQALASGEGLVVHQETISFPKAIECQFNENVDSGLPKSQKLTMINEFGNGPRIDASVTARIEQNYSVKLPSQGKICDIKFNFPEQTMQYDDEIFLLLNNYVLMSSQNYSVNSGSPYYMTNGLKVNDLGLQEYNWMGGANALYGLHYGNSVTPRYCLGIDQNDPLYNQKCALPPTETLGQIKLDIPSEEIVKVGFASSELAELQDINFGFVSTGDNDNGDCEHSAFSFDITVKYLDPTKK